MGRFSFQTWFPASLLIALIAIPGLRTISDYGISWDEANHIHEVRDLVDSMRSGEGPAESQGHYGQLFNLAGEAAYRAITRFRQIDPEQIRRAPYRRAVVRHVLTFLTALMTIALVCTAAHVLAGPPYAFLGGAILALMPRFWGHSFYNAKDIPFAAAFTLVTVVAPFLVMRILQADRGWKRAAGFALFGVLIGTGSATRLGLAVALGLLPVLLLAMDTKRPEPRTLRNGALGLALATLAWFGTTVLLHPASYAAPLAWLVNALTYFSHHPFDAPVLFEGEIYAADELPRRYVATCLWRTTPVLWFALAVPGVALALVRFRTFGPLRRGLVLALLFQLFALPAYAFVKHATVYDGIRQFLFMLPAIAAFAAYGVSRLFAAAGSRGRVALAVLLTLYSGSVVREMHTLHPYQATYFHEPIGGIAGAQDEFELDYWGLSMRECAEYLNVAASPGDGVVLGGNPAGTRAYLDWKLRPLYWEDYREGRGDGEYRYYIALRRTGPFEQFPNSPVVHAVERKGVVLCQVREIAPEDRVEQFGTDADRAGD